MTASIAPIKLYNTLTKAKEVLRPHDEANVRMYVCGPTVYDYAHIGNARPVIVFDILFRLLRYTYGEDHVTYVRNITDVDDKINARARRDYPDLSLNEAISRVTQKTADKYHADTTALGCLKPDFEPRATHHVDGMIDMIQTLIKRRHAYVATGSEGREVLFDTTSMADYGQLSKRKLDEQQAGARIAVEVHKKNPADFVLWKESTAEDPGWDAQFQDGRKTIAVHGRPGWHIECSVMSEALLGKEFDIHGGGLDLIFPHHENELAQSRCAHGTNSMAQIWMHNGFLQVEGQKMSKSLGNFITIDDLLSTKKFGGNKWHGYVLRLAMMMTHYRQPIDWTVDRLVDVRSTLRDWIDACIGVDETIAPTNPAIVDALSDDLNTSSAVSILHRLCAEAKRMNVAAAQELAFSLRFLGVWNGEKSLDIYGYGYEVTNSAQAEIGARVAARLEALNAKDFAKADEIRNELTERGIQLMDYKDSDTSARKTKWEVKR